MQSPAAVATFGALIAQGVTLRAALAAEIARSHELVWRARALLLAPYPMIRPIAGASEADGPPLTAAVLAKLCAGSLPTTCPSKVWAGESQGSTCDACEDPIAPRVMEYEVDIPNVKVFRFHATCFDVWNRERAWYLEHKSHRSATLAEAVWTLLESHRGQMFCAQCLAEILGVSGRIDRALMSVEGRGVSRRHERCSVCDHERLVCGLTAEPTLIPRLAP